MAFNFGDDDWSTDEEDESIGLEYNRLETRTHSSFSYKCGRVEVGGYEEGGESMRVAVEFDDAFPGGVEPMVFCQMEGEDGTDYPDVFGCTIVGSSAEGFSVNCGRGGPEKNWGQNCGMNWIAIDASENNPMISCMQVDVGECGGGSVEATVEFPMPLAKGQKPFIMATCFGEDYTDSFAVTLKKVTRRSASFRIARLGDTEHGQGWGQNVRLNVCYFMQGLFPTMRVHIGASDENFLKVEEISWGAHLRRKPITFAMVQHSSDTQEGFGDSFIATVTNVQRDNFQLNVMRADEPGGWGMETRAVVALIL